MPNDPRFLSVSVADALEALTYGINPVTGSSIDTTRTSDVRTVDPAGMATQTIGNYISATARVAQGGTFSKIRFCVGGSLTAITEIVLGVHSSDGTVKLAETTNLIGLGGITTPATNTLIDNIPLLAPVTLNSGQIVNIGIGGAGTTMSVMGFSLAVAGVGVFGTPQRTRTTTWTTGAAPTTLTAGGYQRIPWIELIP
jgi:hypothetical protein